MRSRTRFILAVVVVLALGTVLPAASPAAGPKPETIRLQALAERRFGDAARAVALLDEAEALAARLGAGIVLPRIAASR